SAFWAFSKTCAGESYPCTPASRNTPSPDISGNTSKPSPATPWPTVPCFAVPEMHTPFEEIGARTRHSPVPGGSAVSPPPPANTYIELRNPVPDQNIGRHIRSRSYVHTFSSQRSLSKSGPFGRCDGRYLPSSRMPKVGLSQ